MLADPETGDHRSPRGTGVTGMVGGVSVSCCHWSQVELLDLRRVAFSGSWECASAGVLAGTTAVEAGT